MEVNDSFRELAQAVIDKAINDYKRHKNKRGMIKRFFNSDLCKFYLLCINKEKRATLRELKLIA